jgi:hypothetical protein
MLKEHSSTPERRMKREGRRKKQQKGVSFCSDIMFTQNSNSEIQVASVGRSEIMATKYITVTEVLKLVSPFSGNKREVLMFVSNVTLGSKFRESALLNCNEEECAGIFNLSDKMRNICSIQGLYSDRIQTIVHSRNDENFDDSRNGSRRRDCYCIKTGEI